MNRGYPDLCKNDSHSHTSLKHDPNTHKKDGEAELLFKNALHKYHGTLLFTCGTQVQVSTFLWNASSNPTMKVLKKCLAIVLCFTKNIRTMSVTSVLYLHCKLGLVQFSVLIDDFEHVFANL